MAKNIKSIKPSKTSGFIQSYYKPVNEQKYVGELPIITRSSWEKKFAIYCDSQAHIVKWASEPFQIKYISIVDRKEHIYWPDFYIKVKRNGFFEEYVIEIKPKDQLKKPTKPKNKNKKSMARYHWSMRTYLTNLSKITALKRFAKDRNYKVILLTEKSFII